MVFTIYGLGGHLGHVTDYAALNALGSKFDLDVKQVKVNLGSSFEQTW